MLIISKCLWSISSFILTSNNNLFVVVESECKDTTKNFSCQAFFKVFLKKNFKKLIFKDLIFYQSVWKVINEYNSQISTSKIKSNPAWLLKTPERSFFFSVSMNRFLVVKSECKDTTKNVSCQVFLKVFLKKISKDWLSKK